MWQMIQRKKSFHIIVLILYPKPYKTPLCTQLRMEALSNCKGVDFKLFTEML